MLDAKLLTINSETLSPDSVVSLNLKSVKNESIIIVRHFKGSKISNCCRYTNKRTKFKIAGTVQKETPQVCRRKEKF